MKIELSHDSLARQVFDKASTEARTRRKVERYVRERYAAYQERGAKLSQDDVDFVTPYLSQVNITVEEAAFLEQGQQELKRRKQNVRWLIIITILALLSLTAWAQIESEQAATSEERAKANAERAHQNAERAEANAAEALAAKRQDSLRAIDLGIALEAADAAKRADSLKAIELGLALNEANLQRLAAERKTVEAQALVMIAAATALPRTEMPLALRVAEMAYEHTDSPQAAVLRGMSSIFYNQLAHDDKPNQPFFSHRFKASHDKNFNFGNSLNKDFLIGVTDNGQSAKIWKLTDNESILVHGDAWRNDTYVSQNGEILVLIDFEKKGMRLMTFDGEHRHDFNNYSGDVRQLYFSADQQYILSRTFAGEVAIWNTEGNIVFSSPEETITYASAQFLADQNTVVLLTTNGGCQLWSIDEEKYIEPPSLLPDSLQLLNVSPDGKKWVIALKDGSAQIRDEQGNLQQELPNLTLSKDASVSFSNNSRYFIIHGFNPQVWDVNGTLYQEYNGLDYSLRGFSPDGELVLMNKTKTGYSGLVNDLNWVRLEALSSDWATEFLFPGKMISFLGFTQNGDKLLVSGGRAYKSESYYLYKYPLKGVLMDTYFVNGLNHRNWFSPHGSYILNQRNGYSPTLLNSTGELIALWNESRARTDIVAFSNNNEEILFEKNHRSICYWNPNTLEQKEIVTLEENILELSFAPNGQYFLVKASESGFMLFDIHGVQVSTFASTKGFEKAMFSPDGNHIVTYEEGRNIKLWSLAADLVRNINYEKEEITSLSFSHDSRFLLISASTGRVVIWSLDDEKITDFDHQLGAHTNAQFSPNDELILTRDNESSVKLWDKKGRQLVDFTVGWHEIFASSPDSKYFATTRGGIIKIFNRKGQVLSEYRHHNNTIYHLSFSADGQYLISASLDDTVKRYPTPQRIYDYLKHEAPIPELTKEQRILYGID